MGICLKTLADDEAIDISWHAWWYMLQKALENGWQPAGTTAPWENWSGTYFTNDGQLITVADADQLKKALEGCQQDRQIEINCEARNRKPNCGDGVRMEGEVLQKAIEQLIKITGKAPLIIE